LFFVEHGFLLRRHTRELQQYCVQVFPHFLRRYEAQVEKHPSGIMIWHGEYDRDHGLSPGDIETVF
jgi:hypothetical protein